MRLKLENVETDVRIGEMIKKEKVRILKSLMKEQGGKITLSTVDKTEKIMKDIL